MIKEDTIIKLDDNKEYNVLDSLVKDNNNFICFVDTNCCFGQKN